MACARPECLSYEPRALPAAMRTVDNLGYSGLMGEDEAGAAKSVCEPRDAARPLVVEKGGRIVRIFEFRNTPCIREGPHTSQNSSVFNIHYAYAFISKAIMRQPFEMPESAVSLPHWERGGDADVSRCCVD